MKRWPFVLSLSVLSIGCTGQKSSSNPVAEDTTVDDGTDSGAESMAHESDASDAGSEDTGIDSDEIDLGADKKLLWGDLHVHTNYSFDAFFFNSLNGPDEAYAFARGAAAAFPCGDDPDTACTERRLDVPLDFVAISDHAEFLGLAVLCGVDGDVAANRLCPALGKFIRGNIAKMASGAALPPSIMKLLDGVIDPKDAWQRVIRAADAAYEPGVFTTFVAFEHSPNIDGAMNHRNVLFKGSDMPVRPISMVDAPDEWSLFRQLDAVCPPGDEGPDCEYLTIPHNPNFSEGRMFAVPMMDGDAPVTDEQMEQGSRADAVVELFQHKGQSECQAGYSDALAAGEDSACDFENARPICTGTQSDEWECVEECTSAAASGKPAVPENCTAPNDMVRSALIEGLRYEGDSRFGFGFVGASDSHNGDPGFVSERGYGGHGGVLDDGPEVQMGAWECPNNQKICSLEKRVFNRQAFRFNPGGLTGVWAEQNTREEIFDALRRKEVYATTGPRIGVRVYAGWDLPQDLCERLSADGEGVSPEELGAVPMGGTLGNPPIDGVVPTIVVNALADPAGGTPLQRVEIVKGWLDESGEGHVRVVRVVGDETGPSPSSSCAVTKTGEPEHLCGVFHDTDFDPTQRAFYYARVLENPSCRWNTWTCVDKGVDCKLLDKVTGTFKGDFEGYEGCCDIKREVGAYRGVNRFDVIEERAWASPVWYRPVEENKG